MKQTDVETMTTNGAVHDDASNGPASKRKLDDVTKVPSADVEGREGSETAPTETEDEDLEVPAMSTEVGEDVSEKTKALVTDAADKESEDKEENGTENGTKETAEKTGEDIGKATVEVEANGGKQEGTGALSEEKAGEDASAAAPAPKRHKPEE